MQPAIFLAATASGSRIQPDLFDNRLAQKALGFYNGGNTSFSGASPVHTPTHQERS